MMEDWVNIWMFKPLLQGHSRTEKGDKKENEQGSKFKDQLHLGHCKKERSWRKI